MGVKTSLQFSCRSKEIQAILAQYLSHDEARFLPALVLLCEQAVVEQRTQAVQNRKSQVALSCTKGLGRFYIAATRESGEPTEEGLLLSGQ